MDVSFQLYSARDHTSWQGVAETLAGLGYTRVEGFGGVYDDPAGFRALLDAHGLAMPSGHVFPLETLEDDMAGAVETARTLGISRIFCPAVPPEQRVGDTDHWAAIGRRLAAVDERMRGAGLRFGWHNHDFEFADLGGGTRAMDILLAEAPGIEWEIDVAWIVRGGQDPLVWIDRYGDRISAAHVKDIAPDGEAEDEDGWADVGHGTMDWPAYAAALRDADVDLFVLEHDKPSDVERFARRSIDAFRAL